MRVDHVGDLGLDDRCTVECSTSSLRQSQWSPLLENLWKFPLEDLQACRALLVAQLLSVVAGLDAANTNSLLRLWRLEGCCLERERWTGMQLAVDLDPCKDPQHSVVNRPDQATLEEAF